MRTRSPVDDGGALLVKRESGTRPAIFSLFYVKAERAETDPQLREGTPHAYNRNSIDCSRDAGRNYGYCHCSDIDHNAFTQRCFSRKHEMLG